MKGDIISGKLLYKDDQSAKGIEILQSFTGKTSWIESCITDINGNFNFLTNNQKNKGDLILKVQNTGREISIFPDNEFFSGFPPPSGEKLSLTEDEIELIAKQFINIQVDDAFSFNKESKNKKTDPDELAFYGNEYVEYKFTDYAKLPNMKEFIFEIIAGVILSRENRQDVINILEENTLKKIGPDPLILIDGVPVSESSVVIGLSPENILIEPKLLQTDAGRIPLYKNLLYWNHNLTTDKDGIARVSFPTPDNSGNFRIQCFGLTPEGLAGAGSVFFTVGEF